MTQFRIGGHYRAADGRIIRIVHSISNPDNAFYDGDICVVVEAQGDEDRWYGTGWRRLSDGKYHGGFPSCDLLPGELHQVDGAWVPLGVAEEAPKTFRLPLKQYVRKGYAEAEEAPKPAKITVKRAPLAYFTERPQFDPFGGFFTKPADMADWQDTYFPR